MKFLTVEDWKVVFPNVRFDVKNDNLYVNNIRAFRLTVPDDFKPNDTYNGIFNASELNQVRYEYIINILLGFNNTQASWKMRQLEEER